jgi:hypothetical protein
MGGPPRLVIEFKNADLAKEAPSSGQGTGDLIKAWSVEKKTIPQQTPEGETREVPVVRVSVELNKNITYKVTSSTTACVVDIEEVKKVEETSKPTNIEIPKEVYGQIQKLSVSPSGQPTGTVAVPLGPGDEKAAREMLSEIVPEKPKVEKLSPATVLDNITYKNENGVFTAIITGDGEFQNYKLLSLDPPLRVAVDFYQIKSNLGNKVFQVNSGRIRQIRVGSYPTKTRVVIELNGKTLKDARIVAMEKKMVVKIIY